MIIGSHEVAQIVERPHVAFIQVTTLITHYMPIVHYQKQDTNIRGREYSSMLFYHIRIMHHHVPNYGTI